MAFSRARLGFDRKVRLRWLDAALLGAELGDGAPQLRARLRNVLRHDMAETGPGGAMGKTLTVLLRVWGPATPALRGLREEALRLAAEVSEPDRLWLHWGMVLATHPFALDLVAYTGRLLRLQGEVSADEIHRRMNERWGSGTTVRRAVQRMLANLVEWGVLKPGSTRGAYTSAERRVAPSASVQVWMIEALLRAHGVAVMSLQQIESSPALFPFALRLTYPEMRQSERMELMRHGGDVDVFALR